jgi:hypothetical protein
MRLRIRFQKRDAIRFSSHKDLVRIFQRGFAAAGIPVSFSRGFHPHMRMSFGPPLKTGWEGLDEYMDVFLDEPAEGVPERSNAYLPAGLRVVDCAEVSDGTPKLANDIAAATYAVRCRKDDLSASMEVGGGVGDRVDRILNTPFAGASDTNGKLPEITGVTIQPAGDDICIEYTSTMISGRVVAPHEIVAAAFDDPETFRVPVGVARTTQYVVRDGVYVSPLSRGVVQEQS